MELPQEFDQKIKIKNKIDDASIVIQAGTLRRKAYQFEKTIKLWVQLGASFGVLLTSLVALVTANFKDIFFLAAAAWQALFAFTFIASLISILISGFKLIVVYRGNGVTTADEFVNEIFKDEAADKIPKIINHKKEGDKNVKKT